jgi:hypothetical protein
VKISNNFFSFFSIRNQNFPHIPYVASKNEMKLKKKSSAPNTQPLPANPITKNLNISNLSLFNFHYVLTSTEFSSVYFRWQRTSFNANTTTTHRPGSTAIYSTDDAKLIAWINMCTSRLPSPSTEEAHFRPKKKPSLSVGC